MTHASPTKAPRPSLRRGLNRKGAIGVAFAIGVTAVLGMGALATEAGIWLYQRRSAQDAADAAAYAGVVRLSLTSENAARAAATEVARLNGFTNVGGPLSAPGDTRVRVDIGFVRPPTTPGAAYDAFVTPAPTGSSPNAVRVAVEQVQRSGLANLISTTSPVAWGGAVAVLDVAGPACTLSVPPQDELSTSQVAGRTNIAGSTTVNAPNCIIASNAEGRKSINIQGGAADDLTAAALRASGQCYNCEDVPSANLPGGYISGSPLTENPYAAIDRWEMPRFGSGPLEFPCAEPIYLEADGTRQNNYNSNRTSTILLNAYRQNGTNQFTSASGTTYTISRSSYVATCINIAIGPGQTLALKPGTYFFNDADLRMSGGQITCDCTPGGPGVTLVFTGTRVDRVGNIQITGGTFRLIAPGPNEGNPAIFDGMVIYRDDFARVANSATDKILITGNSSSEIFGGIYAPDTHVELLGTNDMNETTAGNCIAVVAGEITFSGNSGARIDSCEANGTNVARVMYVRLVQ